MKRLRIVLLQNLAVLQPQYPFLPFFSYPPFYSKEWEEFVRTVRANITDTAKPPSLLLQRALLKLYGLIENTRLTILYAG